MIFLKVCILFLLGGALNAEPLSVHETTSYVKASSFMEVLVDKDASLVLSDVVHLPTWQKSTFSNIPSNSTHVVWTRFWIENRTSDVKTIYLKNPRAGMDKIDAYALSNEAIVKTEHLGDQRRLQEREIPHRYSVMRLRMEPHQTIEVVTKLSNSIGPIESEWEIYSEHAFFQFSLMESLWWGAFLGIILALLVYSIPLLLLTKDKTLALYFGLYAFFSLSYQFFLQGVFYSLEMPPFVINTLLQFSGLFFGVFMALFIYRFLKLDSSHTLLIWVFRSTFAFQILNGCLLFGALFFPSLITLVSYIGLLSGLLACVLWFGLVKQLLNATVDRVFYYLLIGYSVIILAYVYQIVTVTGYVAMSTVSIYSVSVASIIEMYFFTRSIAEYLRQMELDHTRKDKLIDSQMRFVSIGRVIGNISHQWKVPLVRLGALLTHIEAVLYVKKPNLPMEIGEIIPQMHTHLAFMQQTINEFYTLYHVKNRDEIFDLVKTVHTIWGMLNAKAILANMKLEIHSPQILEIQGSEHSFAHAMMILIDNAIEIAKTRAVLEPRLWITLVEEDLHVTIMVEDNCGGLDPHVNEASIFEMDVSSHHDESTKEVRGMGLSIAKLLIEGKFGGTIHVEQQPNGLRFRFTVIKQRAFE